MKLYLLKSIAVFSLLMLFTGCNKDDEPELLAPTVTSGTTSANAEITYTTIKINGNVSSEGGSEINSRGVCWSTNQNPTINDNRTSETTNTFTSTISDLVANTAYYFRVYATNSIGTSYGEEQTFSTLTLDDTTWDFLIIHSSTNSWHADVTFNSDGTTVYDEPISPETWLFNGTWSLNGNILTYDMDSSDDPATDDNTYQFTGTLSGNTMSGTYTLGTEIKSWSATKY